LQTRHGQEDVQMRLVLNYAARILEEDSFAIESYKLEGFGYPGFAFSRKYRLLTLRGAVIVVDRISDELVNELRAVRDSGGFDRIIVIAREKRDSEGLPGIDFVSVDEVRALARMLEAKEYHLEPRIPDERLKEIVAKHRGMIIKKGDYRGASLLYIPLYSMEVLAHRRGGLSSMMSTEKLWLSFDGLSGSLIGVDDRGSLTVIEQWMDLGTLDQTAISVYRYIVEEGLVTLPQLEARFKDINNLTEIVSLLSEYNLVEETEYNIYSPKSPPLRGYRSPAEHYKNSLKEGRPGEGAVLDPAADLYALEQLAEGICRIEERMILYYPVYLIVYTKDKDGRISVTEVLIDGLTGERLYEIEDLMARARDQKLLDPILEEIIGARGGNE